MEKSNQYEVDTSPTRYINNDAGVTDSVVTDSVEPLSAVFLQQHNLCQEIPTSHTISGQLQWSVDNIVDRADTLTVCDIAGSVPIAAGGSAQMITHTQMVTQEQFADLQMECAGLREMVEEIKNSSETPPQFSGSHQLTGVTTDESINATTEGWHHLMLMDTASMIPQPVNFDIGDWPLGKVVTKHYNSELYNDVGEAPNNCDYDNAMRLVGQ